MKTTLALLACSLLAASVMAADGDAKADVKAAASKLADKPNYSWTTTSKSEGNRGFRLGPTEGQTEKAGWSLVTSTFNDSKFEMAMKGNKGAIKRDDEWQTAADLEGNDQQQWIARRLTTFKPPATEAEELADKVKDLKKGDDGSYAGELTTEGAKSLLMRFRRGGDGPPDAKGTAKFWIKDGVLSKFEQNVQGTTTRPDTGDEIKINRTTTTEIKDIGTTKVNIPAEVKKKLS